MKKIIAVFTFFFAFGLIINAQTVSRSTDCHTFPASAISWLACLNENPANWVDLASDVEVCTVTTSVTLPDGRTRVLMTRTTTGLVYNKLGIEVPFNLRDKYLYVENDGFFELDQTISTGSLGGMQILAHVTLSIVNGDAEVDIENLTFICK
ncbi:hypothetical protein GM418_18750 [Maribellus comscasis]|uniref:Uncharacterized protein n=1 Tax=Maribellus comscasis TaxID=2681766 RepID=A0A6I6JZI0_9BACT|nr:hypothetical protein [Maribellus comscasis]QGY45637.1 hypothetical protein GM418_18750 [Maribellus comscasis]